MAGVEAEAAVARIAAVQQGIVSSRQLVAAGFGANAIARRVAGGWLVRRHPGVYQVGVHGGPFSDEMVALPGVRRHVTRWLPPGDIVERRGLPVTTPARTLLDLAATTSRRDLERLVEE